LSEIEGLEVADEDVDEDVDDVVEDDVVDVADGVADADLSATVTFTAAFFVPSSADVAVMVVVPLALAVTLPLASTDAIAELLLLQDTFLFVALVGLRVAESCSVCLGARVVVLRFKVTLETETFALVTDTLTVTFFVRSASEAAVIVAVPSALAVNFPFASTLATLVLLLPHTIFLFVALSGLTVAVSCMD